MLIAVSTLGGVSIVIGTMALIVILIGLAITVIESGR
jgi:hypothetical protein